MDSGFKEAERLSLSLQLGPLAETKKAGRADLSGIPDDASGSLPQAMGRRDDAE